MPSLAIQSVCTFCISPARNTKPHPNRSQSSGDRLPPQQGQLFRRFHNQRRPPASSDRRARMSKTVTQAGTLIKQARLPHASLAHGTQQDTPTRPHKKSRPTPDKLDKMQEAQALHDNFDTQTRTTPDPTIAAIQSKLKFLLTDSTNFALCAEPTSKLCLSIGTSASILVPTECLLDAGAELNLVSPKCVRPQWTRHANRYSLPRLRTATKEPILLDDTNLLDVLLGDLRARVWFETAPILPVYHLVGTSIVDRFIREILFPERKVVSWRSQLVDILATLKSKTRTSTLSAHLHATNDRELDTKNLSNHLHPVRVPKQVVI